MSYSCSLLLDSYSYLLSLVSYSYSLFLTRVILVFTILHSCSTCVHLSTRVYSYSLVFPVLNSCFTHVLLVFTLIHSCSTRVHPNSLLFIGVHWRSSVFISVHWCSTRTHRCSFMFPFVWPWCFRLDCCAPVAIPLLYIAFPSLDKEFLISSLLHCENMVINNFFLNSWR